MVYFSADYARSMNPEVFAEALRSRAEGDMADTVGRSNEARERMEAALLRSDGADILKMLSKLLMPLLDSLVPGLGTLLGGLKGGGGKK